MNMSFNEIVHTREIRENARTSANYSDVKSDEAWKNLQRIFKLEIRTVSCANKFGIIRTFYWLEFRVIKIGRQNWVAEVELGAGKISKACIMRVKVTEEECNMLLTHLNEGSTDLRSYKFCPIGPSLTSAKSKTFNYSHVRKSGINEKNY